MSQSKKFSICKSMSYTAYTHTHTDTFLEHRRTNFNNGYDICIMVTASPFNFTDSIAPGKPGPVFPKLTMSTGYQSQLLKLQSTGNPR